MKKATIRPTRKPVVTCDNVCCRKIMRLVPTIPPNIRVIHNHHVGLKAKIKANANNAPATPPMAAVCVEIFHQTLIIAQIT